MTAIVASNLCKTYSGTSEPVLNKVNLTVEKGDFLAIMGSSGSGKSTLLYLLSGLDDVSAGSIHIGDQDMAALNESGRAILRRRKVGFVYQDFNLIPHLNVLQNVAIPARLVEKDWEVIKSKAMGLLKTLDIEALAYRKPSKISGGEAQRCSVARALINDPEILFADEPTGNLNSSVSLSLLNEFEKINAAGQTIVMVTHDLKAASRAKKMVYLKDGQILDQLDISTFKGTQMEKEEYIFGWLKKQGW